MELQTNRVWGLNTKSLILTREVDDAGLLHFVLHDPAEEACFIDIDLEDLLAVADLAREWYEGGIASAKSNE